MGKDLNMKILVEYENTLSNVIFTTEKTKKKNKLVFSQEGSRNTAQ